MELKVGEIALTAYHWTGGDEGDKVRLFEHQPRYRKMYVRLPDEKIVLFATSKPSLWPELIKFNYCILKGSFQSKPILLKTLD